MANNDNAPWPYRWEAILREHWPKGASASDITRIIAATYGDGPTRNAVIGKARRLGLARDEDDTRRAYSRGGKRGGESTSAKTRGPSWTPKDIKPPRPKPVHVSTITGGIVAGSHPIEPLPPHVSPPIAASGPISLFDITSRTCCWPVGDGKPEWLFCGAPRDPLSKPDHDRGYCEEHQRKSVASPGIRGRRPASLEAMVAEAEGRGGRAA